VDALEGLLHIRGIEPDQWILANLGAMNGLGFYFIDGALAALLGPSRCRKRSR